MNELRDNRISEPLRIRLADRNIEVQNIYRRLQDMCRDYTAAFDEPDLRITVTAEDIERERLRSAEADALEGRVASSYGNDYLETLAVYRQIADGVFENGILLLHGAAVAVGERCFLFLAKSGVGKTTHIRNWLKAVPGAYVVNGDKPLINIEKKLVYGTPWCGKENMNRNTAVPLAGLIELNRGEENRIERISFGEILSCLLSQCYCPEGNGAFVKTVRMLRELKDIPCYRLFCNREEASALVSYAGLTEE